jgi:peptidoglycan/LPS O-acetylase OafA/YrhL
MTVTSAPRATERLRWLDTARLLSALMILGIHWLHACYNVGVLGHGHPSDFVMAYHSNTGGLRMFDQILVAGTDHHVSTWLSNVIGLLGGFGWEAVSALILISGFSLALAQGNKVLTRDQWITWLGKRAKRILVPFYLVAFFFMTLYFVALAVLHHAHGGTAAVIAEKLATQFHTPLLGVIMSHIVLVDPYNTDWTAEFFAPAWWFIPAILLAYVAYPFARSASRAASGVPLLIGSAVLSIATYWLAVHGYLVLESWYEIVLQESFNFCLGIVVANFWVGPHRQAFERAISGPLAFGIAFAAFVAGNVANWTTEFRPVSSILFGPALVVMLIIIAKQLEHMPHADKLSRIDPYDLYLVHQPFAFPVVLVLSHVLHGYTVSIGWIVFVLVASAASMVLTRVQQPFYAVRRSAPASVSAVRVKPREEVASS